MAITVIADAENGGRVAGGTGVVVTHGLTLLDEDVLVAFVGAARADQTDFASTDWTVAPSSYGEAAGGNDRAMAALYKVIASAAGEPSTYTFTRTGDSATHAQAVIIVQCRGVDNSTPIDNTSIPGDESNTFTPNAPDITTVTDGALILTAKTMVSATTEVFDGVTPLAPSTMTLADSIVAGDGATGNPDLMLAVAYKTGGSAGVQSLGLWQTTGGTATWDNALVTVALRVAEEEPDPPDPEPSTTGAFPSLRSLRSLVSL
jgi:hypothetical protein